MSLSEMVFLAFLGLVIFGPKKLAHVGQYVGRALAEFKKTSAAFQAQLADEIKSEEKGSSQTRVKEVSSFTPSISSNNKQAA